MIRIIIVAIIAWAVYWCYNNIDFNNIANNVNGAIQNEKTIKAVNSKRAFDYEQETKAMNNEE